MNKRTCSKRCGAQVKGAECGKRIDFLGESLPQASVAVLLNVPRSRIDQAVRSGRWSEDYVRRLVGRGSAA